MGRDSLRVSQPIRGQEETSHVPPCLQRDTAPMSPRTLTSQGQCYVSRPHSCLLDPQKPLTLNTAQFALHIPHHSKCLHHPPGRPSQRPSVIQGASLHPTPSPPTVLPSLSIYFLNPGQGPAALVSLSPAPLTPSGKPALTNQAEMQTLLKFSLITLHRDNYWFPKLACELPEGQDGVLLVSKSPAFVAGGGGE